VELETNNDTTARIDLVYAKVTIDLVSGIHRKVKNPTTQVVATEEVQSIVRTTVEVLAQQNMVLPTDMANVYFIPLAYVRVHPGFGIGAHILNSSDVWECSPTAGSACRVANRGHELTTSSAEQWSITGQRPAAYLPSTMSGKEELLIAVDLASASPSHISGAMLDDSRDWSNRVYRWTAFARGIGVPRFAWEAGITPDVVPSPDIQAGRAVTGLGHSFGGETNSVFYADSSVLSDIATWISIDSDVDGRLFLWYDGSPGVKLFVWLEASAQFTNGGN
jgi:hypothetical protein